MSFRITRLRLAAAGISLASTAWAWEPGLVVPWGLNSSAQLNVPPPNADFILLSAGAQHSLGLKSDGSLVAWGLNGHGQLNIPQPNSGWVSMDAGTQHSAGLRADGSLAVWGDNNAGQCNVPEPNTNYIQVTTGATFTLGLKADGTLHAWGANDIGQLNLPTPNEGFTRIASGPYHSLALREDGSLAGWGANQSGQSNAPNPNGPFVDMACGLNHSLALRPDGSIVAWGLNTAGQCNVPLPNTGYVAVMAGMFHSLAMREDGSLIAWGNNIYGQSEEPLPDTQFQMVSSYGWHNLALQHYPACMVSTDSLDFGSAQPDVTVARTFTLSNAGGGVLTGSVSSSCAQFTVEGSADFTLAAGASQDFTLRFLGGEPGSYTCELSTGSGCAPLHLSAVADAWPACAVSADSLDFGSVQPDVPVARTFTLSNAGGGVLAGSVSSSCAQFTVEGSVDFTLAAGASQDFTLRFLGGEPGSYSCELSTGSGCAPLHLSAVADAWPACAVSADSLDFGSAQPDVPVTRTFTLSNAGGGVLAGSVSSSCAPFTVEGSADYSLAAGASQDFTLLFLGGEPGSYTCELSTGSGCAPLHLSAVADAWPACAVSADSLDFGSVQPDVPVTRTFTLSNAGGGVLAGSVSSSCAQFTVEGEASYQLAAGASQEFTLRFLGGEPGSYSCDLSTGSGCGPITLSAVAEAWPACVVSADSLDFGSVQPDVPVARTFTLSNAGGGVLAGSVSSGCAQFTVEGEASYQLAAGASQDFTLLFLGGEPGSYSCELSTGSGCAPLHLNAVAEAWPLLVLEPDTLRFDTLLPGSVATAEIQVRNGGGGTLTGILVEPGGAFSLVGDPHYALAAGASTSFQLQVQSEVAGMFTARLRATQAEDSVALSATMVSVQWVHGPASECGLVEDLGHLEGAATGFLVDWRGGLVGLDIQPAPDDNMSIHLIADGAAVWSGAAVALWRSAFIELDSLLAEDRILHLVLEDGIAGVECAWELRFASLEEELPTAFALHPAAPNPFNPSTTLQLDLPLPGVVTVTAYDLLGRRVEILLNRALPAGRHELRWQPRGLASGSYFLVAESTQGHQVRKVLLLK